jgi:flagellar basal body rod protein FlgG
MKKIYIFCGIWAFFSCFAYADDNDLLNDYKLLYVDLINMNKWGYKSFFNNELNRSAENINVAQGSLFTTEVKSDFSIIGEGFFKIRLENDLIGYTRSGEFRFDEYGNMVTPRGYPFYDNIRLEGSFLSETMRITRDHTIYVSIIVDNNNITEIQVGQLLTYNIPSEYLSHYKEAIYIIKDDIEYGEEITFDNQIVQGTVESSNVNPLPVILRMYYILSVIENNLISNIEYKKELLKHQIERMANVNYPLREMLFYLHGRINNKYSNRFYSIHEYLDNEYYYLKYILPFIKYDY